MQRLERRGFAGQVLVASGEDILFLQTYGPRRPGHPERIARDDVMPLASLSKPFTASLVLRLEAAGQLQLSDPIGQHLPGIPPDWSNIPIHAFLSHQAGLPAEIVNRAWAGEARFEPVDRQTFVARLTHFSPDHLPGEGFNYSNVGYTLMAAMIETITGLDFETALDTHLLAPNELRGIGFARPDWTQDRLVHGREGNRDRGHYLDQPRLADGLGFQLRGAGDLMAEPAAIAHWWQAVMRGQWLPEPQKSQWLQPLIDEPDGSQYGLGLHFRQSRHGPVIGHTGGDFLFAVDFSWFSDRQILVYIASADPRHEADRIRDGVHAVLFR